MAGLRSEPSRMTPCSWTFTDVWMSWTPSIMISGSTMGTRPASWQMRVAREVLGRDLDREVRGAVVRDVDLERRAPLGEARALGVVLLAALEEAVEARAPVLAGARTNQRSQAHVDLDARDDVVRLEHVDEGLAGRVVLEERLLVEDRAGDVLVDARRREEQVAPRLAVRLRVLEADGLEALADGARRLVAGQEALAGRTMELAVWTSSSAYFSRLICGAAARADVRCCVENVFVGTSADAGALRARARMADFIVDRLVVLNSQERSAIASSLF